MSSEIFTNVFDAIAKSPEEAANLKARAALMSAIVEHVNAWQVSQQVAATRLGVTRPRLNNLLRGKLSNFSLDALVNLAAAAGLTLDIRIAGAA